MDVTAFYSNIFLIGENPNLFNFDPFWTDLIQSDPKTLTLFILMVNKVIIHKSCGGVSLVEQDTIEYVYFMQLFICP